MNTKYDLVYLEDPKNAQGAFDDPSKITGVVNSKLKDEDPAAYDFLKAITIDENQLNEMEAGMVAARTGNEEKGIENWYKKNKDIVKPWVDAAKNA
jgi:glycine betaine/proline transport system substrate-binding protein